MANFLAVQLKVLSAYLHCVLLADVGFGLFTSRLPVGTRIGTLSLEVEVLAQVFQLLVASVDLFLHLSANNSCLCLANSLLLVDTLSVELLAALGSTGVEEDLLIEILADLSLAINTGFLAIDVWFSEAGFQFTLLAFDKLLLEAFLVLDWDLNLLAQLDEIEDTF